MAPPLVLPDGPPASNQVADHAAFVLLAEFDIDQGSTLAHQYPFPTGTDEQLVLAFVLVSAEEGWRGERIEASGTCPVELDPSFLAVPSLCPSSNITLSYSLADRVLYSLIFPVPSPI